MTRPRWLRIVRRRPAAFAALLILSAGAVLVSAVTPVLLASLDAATLREGVEVARVPRSGAVVTVQLSTADALEGSIAAADAVLDVAAAGSDRWGPIQRVLEWRDRVDVFRADDPDGSRKASFTVLTGDCGGVRPTAGRCASAAGEVMVAESLARVTGWGPGTDLSGPLPGPARVVGVFGDRRGAGAVLADPAILQGARTARSVPNLVFSAATAGELRDGFQLTAARGVVQPVRESDLPALARGLAEARRRSIDARSGAAQLSLTIGLTGLLDSIRRQQEASAVLTAPIGLAAVVLAWAALFFVAQRTARTRAVEWGIGRMRGLRTSAQLAAVFTEPVVAVAIGSVAGFGLALLTAALIAAAVLGPASVVSAPAAALVAADAAAAGSLIALAAASARAALLPLDELLRDTVEPRRATRAALVARIAVLTLTAAVLWTALTAPGGTAAQLVLLLPVLLALVVGLAARTLAVVVVRRTSDRRPQRLGGLIVGRGLARAPSALAGPQLVLVAAALAAFVLQAQAASVSAQADRAELAVGAPQVLSVAVPAGTSLLEAVRRADPAGRTAMAAAEVGGVDDVGGAHLVALDTARAAAVSAWRPAWRGSVALSRLRVPSGGDLMLRGTELEVGTSAPVIRGTDGSPRAVTMNAVVAAASGWRQVQLGRLRAGTLSASIPCAQGCRLVSIGFAEADFDGAAPWRVRFTIRSLATDRQSAPALRPWLAASRWWDRRVDAIDPTSPATTAFSDAVGGLGVEASDAEGQRTPVMEPAVGPLLLPAIAAQGAPLSTFAGVTGSVQGSGLSGSGVLLRPVGTAPAVPRALRDGVVVDLGAALRVADPGALAADQQVWLTAGDHPQVIAALQRQGIRVLATTRTATVVADALQAPGNRALVLVGTTALAAVLFALLALVAAQVIDAPARRHDWRVLRTAGADQRRLRRLAAVQVALPAAVAVLLGLLTGVLAATLTVGGLPLLVGLSAGPPIDVGPPVWVLIGFGAVLLVLVAAVSSAVAAFDLPRDRRTS